MTGFLPRIIPAIARVTAAIAGVALISAVILLVSGIVFRLFGNPIAVTYEVMGLLAVVVLGLSFGDGQVAKAHVAIDLFTARLNKPAQLILEAVITLLSIATFIVVMYALWGYGVGQTKTGTTTELLKVPTWPWVFVLMFGFGVVVLALIQDFLKIIQAWITKTPLEDEQK
ncbi:TRAP-type C4-dicarboxylate transport system permease small subunit [Rhodoglobus vestalii]|uniref:TRAP-type C4-dicarboxylate transport system permease small subunit n=1 Tax=Rhodoglobus vestalii TaxID=193384 RepID=A0A8H2KB72_9MICO|nr:TRAP transporter small permease [Rhodoglobus vestalii]TQO20056.1 TRAP-type C4-dicarboxylate transport system permease small subunit [Rhodoglobus vestalii]